MSQSIGQPENALSGNRETVYHSTGEWVSPPSDVDPESVCTTRQPCLGHCSFRIQSVPPPLLFCSWFRVFVFVAREHARINQERESDGGGRAHLRFQDPLAGVQGLVTSCLSVASLSLSTMGTTIARIERKKVVLGGKEAQGLEINGEEWGMKTEDPWSFKICL